MLTLFIVFSAIVLAGLGFWFYNRRQVKNLNDVIGDKTVVITMLQEHLSQTEDTLSQSVVTTPAKQGRRKNNNRNQQGNKNQRGSKPAKIESTQQQKSKKTRPKNG